MEGTTRTGWDAETSDRLPPHRPVAIVGYSYRMPGGIRTDEDFWRLLGEREIVQEPIADRYGRGYRPVGGFSGPGRFASRYEGLIRDDGEKLFDRGLFGLSQNEVTSMDPQMRMLLTCGCEPFPDRPVVIGVNSFGFGGANGHCVVREYRPERPRSFSVPLAPAGAS